MARLLTSDYEPGGRTPSERGKKRGDHSGSLGGSFSFRPKRNSWLRQESTEQTPSARHQRPLMAPQLPIGYG